MKILQVLENLEVDMVWIMVEVMCDNASASFVMDHGLTGPPGAKVVLKEVKNK